MEILPNADNASGWFYNDTSVVPSSYCPLLRTPIIAMLCTSPLASNVQLPGILLLLSLTVPFSINTSVSSWRKKPLSYLSLWPLTALSMVPWTSGCNEALALPCDFLGLNFSSVTCQLCHFEGRPPCLESHFHPLLKW